MKEIYIEGSDCTTKSDLFKTFSEVFEFPDYFANNWDSFDEIICDLSWIPENEIHLEVSNYNDLLSKASDEDQDIFYEILSNVEEYSEKTFTIEFV